MAEVVVVGSLMIDLVSITDRIPKPGETIHGKSFVQNFGGKGANQCVAASRLGANTAMVGKLGDDHFGISYKTELENSGINTDHLDHVSNTSSGIASIWVDSQGQNSIIITGNSNDKLDSSDVQRVSSIIKQAKIVICQLEVPLQVSLAALKIAKSFGVRSILNPAPATENVGKELFGVVDIICPNETEAELLVGFPVDSEESYTNALQKLLQLGASTAIITLGGKGAVFASVEEPETTRIQVDEVKVVDSTGAGDAFVGALAYFIVKDPASTMAEKVRKACKYASNSVTKVGTQPSYAKMEELEKSFF